MNTDHLIFNTGTAVQFGGNTFINVPTILQIDDNPIVETVTHEELTRTTQFEIYGPDGVYLAKVKGPRLFLTDDGRKANLTLDHPDKVTVCELNGTTLFEVRRNDAAAIALTAELYSPNGCFVKANAEIPFGSFSNDGTQLGGCMFTGNTVEGCRIGYLIKSDGSVAFGCS